MNDDGDILAANAAYYRAFAIGDLEAMGRLWADEGVSCIHPGWPALIGRETVIESYREIMRHPDRDQVEHRNDQAVVAGDEGRVLCVEFIDGVALATTNWFRRIGGTWRMIHHQASPIAGRLDINAPTPFSQRLN